MRDNGICELDLFVGRTSSQEVERRLCHRCVAALLDVTDPGRLPAPSRLRRAIERPIEVGVTGKGIDAVTTELCVTAPMDAGGYARPRVLLGAYQAQWFTGFGLTTELLCFRCDQRASASGHHGVQGACMPPRLRLALTHSVLAGRHPHSAHPWQAASRGSPFFAHRRQRPAY